MHTPPLIMIADDEPEITEVLQKICTRAGFGVINARDGVEAVNMAQQHLPDLMLLDIQMPKLNGWEVLAQLREEEATRQIAIIVLTAAATKPEDAAQGIELGADDYIVKPFNYQELVARIRAKIRAKRLEESLQQRSQELEALVRLGVNLSRPLEPLVLTENVLAFLGLDLKASASLIHFRSKQGIIAYALPQDGTMAPIHLTVNLDGFSDPEKSYLLNAEEAAELFNDSAIITGIIAPIHYHNEQLGFIAIGHQQVNVFGENELRIMSSASKQIALAISNSQLYEELRGYANELEARVEARTAELKSTQAQLFRSEKLASLGRLASEIAHEINNPLQPIMTFLEDAVEDIESERDVDVQGLRLAMDEVQRLKRTVKRLLDFAKPDNSAVGDVNMKALITETMQLTQKQLERNLVKLETELHTVPIIQASHDQIKQVLLNLVLNAMQAMTPQGGSLYVRLWKDEAFVHFTVRDTGSGISPDNLKRLFEPFFSSKKEGTGIGLAVSHSIIEAHGGRVDVQSEVGVGTEFKVSLPLN